MLKDTEITNLWEQFVDAIDKAYADLVRDYQGGHQDAMPSSLRWLKIRRTVAEAELLGWIVRDYLTREWVLAVEAIDYTKLHN